MAHACFRACRACFEPACTEGKRVLYLHGYGNDSRIASNQIAGMTSCWTGAEIIVLQGLHQLDPNSNDLAVLACRPATANLVRVVQDGGYKVYGWCRMPHFVTVATNDDPDAIVGTSPGQDPYSYRNTKAKDPFSERCTTSRGRYRNART